MPRIATVTVLAAASLLGANAFTGKFNKQRLRNVPKIICRLMELSFDFESSVNRSKQTSNNAERN
jgi:hypothetical protein